MILQVYSIYDKRARVYQGMICFTNDDVALRYFSDLLKDKNSMIGAHPEDYIIFNIGQFNDTFGKFSNHKTFVEIINSGKLGGDINGINSESVEDLQ